MTTDERAAELLESKSRDDLRELAAELGVEGRSGMSKPELSQAIAEREAEHPESGVDAIDTRPPVVDPPPSDVDAIDPPVTDGEQSVAGVVAQAELDGELEPATPEETGRPDLVALAEARAADRIPARVIGAAPTDTEED